MEEVAKIVEGIVLKTTNYQETSKICQVFTREHGLISLYLRGANRYQSKSYQLAQEMTHASFSIYYKPEGLMTSFHGEVLNNFSDLKIDFSKNIFIYHVFELILKALDKHQAMPVLFDLLMNWLNKMSELDDRDALMIYTLAIELKLLYFIGVTPVLDRCTECGKQKNIANFDPYLGGFICRECLHVQQNPVRYSLDSMRILLELFSSSLEDINVPNEDYVIPEIRQIVDEFYRYHLSLTTRSRKFFESSAMM